MAFKSWRHYYSTGIIFLVFLSGLFAQEGIGIDQLESAPGGNYFPLTEDGTIFPETGVQVYRKFDVNLIDSLFHKGDSICISFINDSIPAKCVLDLNDAYNDAELRDSITSHRVDITELQSRPDLIEDNDSDPSNEKHLREGNSTSIAFPQGGINQIGTTVSGYLKITLPNSWSNTMLKFDIDVFDYATNQSCRIEVAGYTYINTPAWLSTSATTISSNTNINYTIRFGHDGDKCAIYIGESNTSWAYPSIQITHVNASFFNSEYEDWDDGWDISVVNDLGAIHATHTNTNPLFSGEYMALGFTGTIGLADGIDNVDDPDNVVGNEYNTGVSLNGTIFSVTDGGGTKSADLSPIQDGTGTDDQIIDEFSFERPLLRLSIEDDNQSSKIADFNEYYRLPTNIQSGDWDDIIGPGLHELQSSTAPNRPDNWYYYPLVVRFSTAITQYAIPYGNDTNVRNVYVRTRKTSGVWSSWEKQLYESDTNGWDKNAADDAVLPSLISDRVVFGNYEQDAQFLFSGGALTLPNDLRIKSSSGSANAWLQVSAGQNYVGTHSLGLGVVSMADASGSYNNALGFESARNSSGNYLVALGRRSAYNSIGDNVLAIGRNSALNNTGNNVTALGLNSGQSNTFDNVILFNASAANKNNQVVFGTSAYTSYFPGRLGIKNNNPLYDCDITGSIRVTDRTGGAATHGAYWDSNGQLIQGAIPVTSDNNTGLHDFYEVGTGIAPNAITDQKYTYGPITIGTNSNLGVDLGITATRSTTTPFIRLQNPGSGDIAIHFDKPNGTDSDWAIGTQGSSGKFIISGGATVGEDEKMVFEPDGDIGINTTVPTRDVDIVGDVRIRGGLLYDFANAAPSVNGSVIQNSGGEFAYLDVEQAEEDSQVSYQEATTLTGLSKVKHIEYDGTSSTLTWFDSDIFGVTTQTASAQTFWNNTSTSKTINAATGDVFRFSDGTSSTSVVIPARGFRDFEEFGSNTWLVSP